MARKEVRTWATPSMNTTSTPTSSTESVSSLPAATHAQAPSATPSDARKARALTSQNEAAYDAELVRRFNGGDEAAFNEIVSRYTGKIFSAAVGLLRNRADAEEIVQDTLLRVHRGLANFRGESSLATWIHHIAVNLSRNRYWYFYRRRRHDALSLDFQPGEGGATFSDLMASDAPTAPRQAVVAEFSELVTVCMGKLESHQREILTMRAVMNQSYEEIALALGTNVGTVKSRIARARGNLRARMAEACPEFGTDAMPKEWFETERSIQAPQAILR